MDNCFGNPLSKGNKMSPKDTVIKGSFQNENRAVVNIVGKILANHKKFEVIVKDPDTGNSFRPWVTMFIDDFIRMLLGSIVYKELPDRDMVKFYIKKIKQQLWEARYKKNPLTESNWCLKLYMKDENNGKR